MTDITAESQQQIFHQPLEGAELDNVTRLVRQHKANAAMTQQLALDASKLIASSQDRLQQQSGSGFFKRFAGAMTAKTLRTSCKIRQIRCKCRSLPGTT
ncbi:hypothetical protein P2G75_18505 [Cronobacter malonaticus]|uniref:hypothetical protein n=1 Tax=Cronobacter malonaticus TaxID=413503 RepID=UPI002DBEEACD|nr:hypothetical protein [Cronobacter malonaticus]MEB8681028.1 hypothetical protein [Cronobacter malonaticus]